MSSRRISRHARHESKQHMALFQQTSRRYVDLKSHRGRDNALPAAPGLDYLGLAHHIRQ